MESWRPRPIGRSGSSVDVIDLAIAILRNGYATNEVGSDGGINAETSVMTVREKACSRR
jgi:hypothetical protein